MQLINLCYVFAYTGTRMDYQPMHLGSGLRFTALSISFQTSLSFQRGLSWPVSLSDVAALWP